MDRWFEAVYCRLRAIRSLTSNRVERCLYYPGFLMVAKNHSRLKMSTSTVFQIAVSLMTGRRRNMPNQRSSLSSLNTCRFSTPTTPNIANPHVGFNHRKSNRTTQSGIWKGCGNDAAGNRMSPICPVYVPYMSRICLVSYKIRDIYGATARHIQKIICFCKVCQYIAYG
jgi:hypothetical protein